MPKLTSANLASTLSYKQRDFLRHYLETGDAVYSMVQAGYRNPTEKEATKMMLNPNIYMVLQQIEMERRAVMEQQITGVELISILAKIARVDITQFLEMSKNGNIRLKDIEDIDGTVLNEIQQRVDSDGDVSFKIKTSDRLNAIGMLLDVLGLRHKDKGGGDFKQINLVLGNQDWGN